jgi:acetoin utilization deacetylase AcuC-like enzyme
VELVYSSSYRLDLPGLAHDPRRGEKILTFLAAEGLVRRGGVLSPPRISFRALCEVHDVNYLEALSDPALLTRVVGFPVAGRDRDRLLDLQRRMCGGTRLAAQRAFASGGIVLHVGGGLHHAFPDHGARFCLLNDVAVAIADERRRGAGGNVLVVDCDLHDGDGTRAIFARDATVHTFSVHNASSGTDEDAVESTSVELGSGVEDERYLAALEEHLPPLVDRLDPVLAFYLAGADVAADDFIGDWKVSAEGTFRRDRWVTELLRRREPPVPLVVLLAGGYGKGSWAYSARYAAWLLAGRRLEPPTAEEMTLARYRRIAREIAPEELSGLPPRDGDDWGLNEEDVLASLAGRRQRFLDFYTLHGVELALERVGLLDRLRRLGFEHPTVEFDLANPAGETVRVYGDAAARELVIELRARRDRQSVPGCETLRVEWLLLQNPRTYFSRDRVPLPGQRHPGLGLLEEVTAMLVLVCDRLGLDGVLFVPSHYHMVSQSRRFLRFLEPEHEGLFRALRQAVAGLALGDASRAVAAGRVVDRASGHAFELPNMPMVLPTTDRLRQRVEGDDYEAGAAAAEARQRLALRGS